MWYFYYIINCLFYDYWFILNTKNNTVLLNSKSTIRAWDIEYIDHVKKFWKKCLIWKKYSNCIYVLFSDWNYEYWVKWLKYLWLRQRKEPKDTERTCYNIKKRYYIEIMIPNSKKLIFHWRTLDEARKNYVSYFSPHDIRQAPDGTLWQYSKFLHDALSWNFHWCYLEKLKPQKGSSTAKSTQYNGHFVKK